MRSQEVMQGHLIGPDKVKIIRDLLARNRDWNRPQHSREVCLRWDWRNGKGPIKDRAARSRLLKLPARGLITLPKRAHPGRPNHRGLAALREIAHQTEAIQRDRFLGACYRAAGWVHVGATEGRGRNDRNYARALPLKDIFVCSLSADFQRRLTR